MISSRLSSQAKKITTGLFFIVPLILAGVWFVGNYFESLNLNDTSLGERIYLQGIDSSGKPLQGKTEGDIEFHDANFNCAQCHRHSGYGSSEGGNYVLPVTGNSLFNPRSFDRNDLFKKLFQENQTPLFWARMRSSYQRPAYTDETLALAVREGIDPSGRKLKPLMPRYNLGDRDMAGLIAYLKTLSAQNDPGVDETAIYLATIVAKRSNEAAKNAMLSTITKFAEWLNMETKGNQAHPNFSPNYRSDFAKAFRIWKHETWEISDNPDHWSEELEAKYADRPVFALIGGIADGDWTPIHEFCERHRIPCLFPLTDLPSDRTPNHYSVYFNEGLLLEAKAIAKYLMQQQPNTAEQIVMFYAEHQAKGIKPANALAAKFAVAKNQKLETIPINNLDHFRQVWANYLHNHPQTATVVIWPGNLGPAIVKELTHSPDSIERIFLPSDFLEADLSAIPRDVAQKLYFAFPYALPDAYQPHAFRVRAWMNTRSLATSNPRIQFNMYYALDIFKSSLEHIVDHFSRDYLLEYIEHEAENSLNPGIFPRLSLGPEQRFASKGAYIVKLDQSGKQLIEPVSSWVVP